MRTSGMTKAFTAYSSFGEIATRYDAFILDQYGVMHDGKDALPGAVECLKRLSSSGKKLIILSNTSSPSHSALARLPKLGFDPDALVGAVTSGNEAAKFVTERYGKGTNVRKALWFTWVNGRGPPPLDFIDRCGSIEVTDDVEEAEFILLHGAQVLRGKGNDEEAKTTSLGDFLSGEDYGTIDPILERCKERGLPMICGNPDLLVMNPDGSKSNMPGKIGNRYESMGGECTYFGKPHAHHFEACLKELGVERHRVAHVGDSLHHDVAGANAAGIASVFVTGGIHRDDLGVDFGELPSMEALSGLFDKEGHVPTHVVPMLKF